MCFAHYLDLGQFSEAGSTAQANPGEAATAPTSQEGPPNEDVDTSSRITVSVSTAFHPAAHLDRILDVSDNGFAGVIPPHPQPDGSPSFIVLSEHSAVLNIVLHTIYYLPCTHYEPSFEVVSEALRALEKYGVQPFRHGAPASPLFEVLRAHAPTRPIESYALAAQYNLEDAAVAISAHLLSFALPLLSDEIAAQIAPLYLKRLFLLHAERTDALKRMLLQPPRPHNPNNNCGPVRQRAVTRAWALSSAQLLWEIRPDLSAASLQAALRPLENDISCYFCKQNLRERISQLVSEWASVKRTI